MLDTSLSFLDQLQQQDDSLQWDQLVNLYTPVFQTWLRSYDDLRGADADDLIQEVLMVVTRELPKFQHNQRKGAFRSWLRQILVNRLRNYWRGKQNQPQVLGGTDFLSHLQELEDANSQMSQRWDREHDLQVMQSLVQLIQPRFAANTWQAFLLQVMEEHSPEEVAKKLDLSLSSVYVAKSRVLHALRKVSEGLIP